jgi:NIPSNAP
MPMIVEERSYVMQPGKVAVWLELYEREGLPIQRPALGNLVGYFSTEFGQLSQIVHLWGYEDLADRQRRRAELAARPDWQAFLDKALPLVLTMENRLLLPAPFSPIGGSRPA